MVLVSSGGGTVVVVILLQVILLQVVVTNRFRPFPRFEETMVERGGRCGCDSTPAFNVDISFAGPE